MSKNSVLLGAIFVLIAIILGAMAAHAMEDFVAPELIDTFEKGVKYQLYTGLGLLIVGFNQDRLGFSIKPFILLNLIGMLLFSGCIYAYTFHEQMAFLKPAVYIVPLGGISMIAAWLFLVIRLIRSKNN